jgi:hypothetical protein
MSAGEWVGIVVVVCITLYSIVVRICGAVEHRATEAARKSPKDKDSAGVRS